MSRLTAIVPLLGLLFFTQPLLAAPPLNAKPLSEIIKMLEDGGSVAYFDEIDWDDDGYWEIEYRRADGSKAKVEIDAVSGQPKR